MIMEKIALSSFKHSSDYLKQIGENGAEKSSPIIDCIKTGLLPKINNQTKVLEIGIGNGASIEEIKHEIKDPSLVVYGMDILEPLARRVNSPTKNVLSVVGNLSQLPFAEKSMSAINVSSVIHEAISYNQDIIDQNLDIDNFLKATFESLIKILAINGVLSYRDPGLSQQPDNIEETEYAQCISEFVDVFIRDFTPIFNKIIANRNPTAMNSTSEGIIITASQHFHREMQRHIISYYDLAFRQTYNITLKAAMELLDNNQITKIEFLSIITSLSKNSSTYSDWFKREGFEVYTYRNLGEIANLLQEVKGASEIDFEIMSSSETKREAYSEFLHMISNTNLNDTKQNLLIKRIK